MKRRILFLGVLTAMSAIAAPARAQVSTLSLSPATGQAKTVGQTACNDGDRVSLNYSVANVVTNTKLWLWVTTDASCGDAPSTSSTTTTTVVIIPKTTLDLSNQSGTPSFLIRDVVPNCPPNVREDLLVCGVVFNTQTLNGTESISSRAQVSVTYTSQPPTTPDITSARGGDGTLYVNWNGEDVAIWHVYYQGYGPTPPTDSGGPCSPPPANPDPEPIVDAGVPDAGTEPTDAGTAEDAGTTEDGGTTVADAGTTTPTPVTDFPGWQRTDINDGTVRAAIITGVTNGRWYRIRVVAEDAAGNISAPSGEVHTQPLLVWDFYRGYKCAGGSEKGGFGCSAAGAAATLVPIAGLGLAALLRRRATRRQG